MKEYKICLWNPGCSSSRKSGIYGCSVYGLSFGDNWFAPEECSSAFWGEELPGLILSGTYRSVIDSFKTLTFTPVICISLFRDGKGVDLFLKQYSIIMPNIPIIGGVAAFKTGSPEGELMPDGEELALFAVSEGKFEIHSLNIYDKTDIAVEILRKTAREFEFLRVLPSGKWQNALDFYRHQQEIMGIDAHNFELITFSDSNDRNMHFSPAGNSLKCGADLPDDNILNLKVTSGKKAEDSLSRFIADDKSLIFGCAGIRSLLEKPVYPGKNSLLVFMFGEVYTSEDMPKFGNLMLAKLIKQ